MNESKRNELEERLRGEGLLNGSNPAVIGETIEEVRYLIEQWPQRDVLGIIWRYEVDRFHWIRPRTEEEGDGDFERLCDFMRNTRAA